MIQLPDGTMVSEMVEPPSEGLERGALKFWSYEGVVLPAGDRGVSVSDLLEFATFAHKHYPNEWVDTHAFGLRVTRGGVKDAAATQTRGCCCTPSSREDAARLDSGRLDAADAHAGRPRRTLMPAWDCGNCGRSTPVTHQSTFCKRTSESDVAVHWCCPGACQLDDPEFRRAVEERRSREMTTDPDMEVPF